jgi:hypothetical protein
MQWKHNTIWDIYLLGRDCNGRELLGGQYILHSRTWVCERFDGKALRRQVFDDIGDDSRMYLRPLLLENSCLIGAMGMPEFYGEYLQRYGPALVSEFEVHDDFSDDSVHHHYGSTTGKSMGMHAMVMVGARKDATHGWCFLLQNWWKNKQFDEVNETYLQRSRALVFFIKTPQDRMNTSLPTVEGCWCECDLLHKPDYPRGEDM